MIDLLYYTKLITANLHVQNCSTYLLHSFSISLNIKLFFSGSLSIFWKSRCLKLRNNIYNSKPLSIVILIGVVLHREGTYTYVYINTQWHTNYFQLYCYPPSKATLEQATIHSPNIIFAIIHHSNNRKLWQFDVKDFSYDTRCFKVLVDSEKEFHIIQSDKLLESMLSKMAFGLFRSSRYFFSFHSHDKTV